MIPILISVSTLFLATVATEPIEPRPALPTMTTNADLQMAVEAEFGRRLCIVQRTEYKKIIDLAIETESKNAVMVAREQKRARVMVVIGLVAGFVVGAGLTVGLVYAVRPTQ